MEYLENLLELLVNLNLLTPFLGWIILLVFWIHFLDKLHAGLHTTWVFSIFHCQQIINSTDWKSLFDSRKYFLYIILPDNTSNGFPKDDLNWHIFFHITWKTSASVRYCQYWCCLDFILIWFFPAERVGVDVVECACVIELPELKVWSYLWKHIQLIILFLFWLATWKTNHGSLIITC